ncbi:hypothetical protein AcW1_002230 [Taiwanofungus camphoratus]|nr:hypothetical protein AcV5_010224 [Antrodia cinnamomea]KAI0944549.1 hypothetical protein AcW1_002230 [Antrodia cinnamomea]
MIVHCSLAMPMALISQSGSPFDTGAEVSPSGSQVDIDVSRRRIRNHSTRGTPTPIFKLPPEILAEVFLIHAAQVIAAFSRRVCVGFYDWINVSHVCSHWRSIAIGCARLWSYILMTHTEWMTVLLDRSKTMPLTVIADRLGKIEERSLELVLKEMPRIRDLRLGGPQNILRRM